MNTLRIGTRDSQLAVWQAREVQRLLTLHGISSELVLVKSEGDLNTTTPLHQMGGVGLFTKILDDALVNDLADIAVHSLKDYPTQAPKGILMAATLARANHRDLLLPRTNASFLNQIDGTATVATGSIRRRAQWLLKYPNHKLENLRGNVNTRLQKLGANGWDGAIFAAAGLERIGLRPANAVSLDWMIPAPAQGAIGITCLEMQPRFIEILKQITHQKTERTTQEERAFLRTLEGGCSAPIGALVQEVQEGWLFEGILVTPDGTKHIRVREICERNSLEGLGKRMAKQVLDEGGHDIMKTIRDAGL